MSVKLIVAYLLLAFGAPLAIGGFVSLLTLPVFKALFGERYREIHFPDDITEGILSMIAAIIMFRLFGISISIAVPIILGAVAALFLSARRERKSIPWEIFGIIVTYIVYGQLFT